MSYISPLDQGVLRGKILAGDFTLGIFIGLNSPMTAEIAAVGGVDWVLLDLEHGGGSEDQVGPTVIATGAYGVPTLVRVESSSRIRIGRALDAGAAGIMLPRLDSPAEIRDAVKHLSYPPDGDRGVATYNRSARWGRDAAVLTGPRRCLGIVQIESATAVENMDEIAAIEGIDVLFIGPLDLSFDLGVPRDFKNPKFIAAIERVVTAATKTGKVTGILAIDAASARDYRARGFNFVAVGSDSTLLAGAVTSIVNEVRS
jgi:4-hydroxy-2-oxoheptanedioate aldolase